MSTSFIRQFILGIFLSLSFNSASATILMREQVFGDLFKGSWAIETDSTPHVWHCDYPGDLPDSCNWLTKFTVETLPGANLPWFPGGLVFDMTAPPDSGQSIRASIAGGWEILGSEAGSEAFYYIDLLTFSLTQSIPASPEPIANCQAGGGVNPVEACSTTLLYDSGTTEANIIGCQTFASHDVMCDAPDPQLVELDTLLGVQAVPTVGTLYLFVAGLLGLTLVRPFSATRT